MSTDSHDSAAPLLSPGRPLAPLQWVGIALSAVSGAIHLWLGVTAFKSPLFIAGVGFAVGIGAVLLDRRREQSVRWGIPFVALQILLYGVGHGFLTAAAPTYEPLEIVDKVAQIGLLGVLIALARRS